MMAMGMAMAMAMLLLTLAPRAVAAAATTTTSGAFPADVTRLLNLQADPCEDFYEFTCGGWLRNFSLPSDRQMYAYSFSSINDRNDLIIQEILQQDPPLLRELWDSCMALDSITAQQDAPLQPTLRAIAAVSTKRQLMQLAATIGLIGPSMVTDIRIGADTRDATTHILYATSGDLVLPAVSYYLNAATFMDVEPAYRQYISTLFSLVGGTGSSSNTSHAQNVVVEMEKRVAAISPTPHDARDPKKSYNPIQYSDAVAQYPLSLGAVVDEGLQLRQRSSLTLTTKIVLTSRSYFAQTEKLLTETPLDELKIYLAFLYVNYYASYLGEPFQQAVFALYSQKLGGQTTRPPRARVCKRTLTTFLPDLLGEYYFAKTFDQQRTEKVQRMIQAVEQAMVDRIATADWLDDATRAEAQTKLRKVANHIGKPTKQQQRKTLLLQRNDYFGNVVALATARSERAIRKLGQRVDRTEWSMSPATVNAYYSLSTNTMVFPAAVLQHPLFSADAHIAQNFGAIGAVIGHELTHGFDHTGRQYDGDGNQRDWWTPTTAASFATKAQCLRDQYGGFVADGDSGNAVGAVDGNLTIGENIADNGGASLALDALRNWLQRDGTEIAIGAEQLFFIAFGQVWCNKARDGFLKQLLAGDPHAPSKFRVNGVAMNIDDFARVFQCKPDSRMNPTAKCKLW